MIIKILKKSATFEGVNYNSGKISKEKGELMKVANFGILQGLSTVKPSDYIHYLEAVSAKNKRIKYPQLHVMLSCKGREYNKENLVSYAEKWLEGMGYGKQPYLLIHHNDTDNNHIHIVSTRVDREGKKINDSFEKIRAYKVLEKISIDLDKKQNTAQKEIAALLSYRFSTTAQLSMLLETKGYHLGLTKDSVEISKFGKTVYQLSAQELNKLRENRQENKKRQLQLKAIFSKYSQIHSPKPLPIYEKLPGGGNGKTISYGSELSNYLKTTFGIQLLYHFSKDKPPYGYTIIDHADKEVFKGSEVMKLKEMIDLELESNKHSEAITKINDSVTAEASTNLIESPEPFSESETSFIPLDISIDISDDIDDEQILGRNRRRKGMARTNTR